MELVGWEEPDPAEILVLGDDDDWAALGQRYVGQNPLPLLRCLEVARACGASTVVIETRYIDLDYRSEYSAFYSKTFRSQPDSAHRLHFFRAPLQAVQLHDLPEDHGYLGYVVIRPSELGTVGRSVLAPPPGLDDAIRCSISDQVNFFGQYLTARGVPFMQQDSQLGRCAHAAAWVCHFTAHRRGDVGRRSMAEFSLSAEPGLGYGRPLPSPGLTVQQLLELLRSFDLPPSFYDVRQLPPSQLVPWADPDPVPPTGSTDLHPGLWDTRIVRIACRYLNSGLPVLVATADHAFVLSGYSRSQRDGGRDWISFVRHDDQRGPYLPVDDVLKDVDPVTQYEYSPWECLIVPLPEKLWLPPEPVEKTGGEFLHGLSETVRGQVPEAGAILDLIANDALALRTYALSSNRFKAEVRQRGLDVNLIREYRLARMSRYVWVVEAIDRRKRSLGEPCVLGEAIFDATSSETLPDALAVHVPGVAVLYGSRTDANGRVLRCAPDPYLSGGAGPA
jgi:hypothetical protein